MNKHSAQVFIIVLVGLAAGVVPTQEASAIDYKPLFTGAVDDNWHVANNWHDGEVPPAQASVLVGSPAYPNRSATIYSGQTVTNATIYVGHGDTGSLTIQAGGTFTAWGSLRVGSHDPFFDATWVTVPVADQNEWFSGCDGTVTINGTVRTNGDLTLAGWQPDSKAKLYLNSGGIIELTGTRNDAYLGKDYHYHLGGYWELYQANGTTFSVADHILMTSRDGNAFWKLGDGTTVRYAMRPGANWGLFHIFNGTFWVDGGTVNVGHGGSTAIYGNDMIFTKYFGTGPATRTPTLKVSGTNPLLTVGDKVAFSGALLDVSELTITPNIWVTIVDANEIAEHTDYHFTGANVYAGDELDFAPGTDTNLWSLRVDYLNSDKVEVMYIPEPAVLALLGVGMAELLRRRRKKRI